ncbi:cytochrome b [Thalassolituus sp. LLYu03]|uniref:cytochrome b n=1 Tax=Thalassolituus sp. LLYu03 TaxID=3421656 RepID=UPI003D2AED9F
MSAVSCSRYSRARRLLHGVSAVIILWALGSGFTLATVPLTASLHDRIAAFNVATTLLFIPFFMVRTLLALWQGKPAHHALSAQQQTLANAGHVAIYGCVLVVLFSGVLMMERPVPVFGAYTFGPLLPASSVTQAFSGLHRVASGLLALLVAGHLLAVPMHQRRGVRLLQRMF